LGGYQTTASIGDIVAISLKSNVLFRLLTPQMVIANQIVASIFAEFGWNTVITSGSDGVHVTNSRHYTGAALDYRTTAQGMTLEQIKAVETAVRAALGKQYFVLREPDHLHVQYGGPSTTTISAAMRRALAREHKGY
jgi:hypothetical protein